MAREVSRQDVSIPEFGVFATLVQRLDHGPMRTTLDTSPKRAVGWYASQKNGGSQFWESRNELHALYSSEVQPTVLRYRTQPHALELVINGKTRTYTPDREDALANGRIEIIEVKGSYDSERDRHYHAKIEIARLVYERRGWSFRMLERTEIEAQPQFEAVKLIQSFRRAVVTQADEDRVYECFAQADALPLAELKSLWETPLLGLAKTCALMVKRTLYINLEFGLSEKTLVRLVTV